MERSSPSVRLAKLSPAAASPEHRWQSQTHDRRTPVLAGASKSTRTDHRLRRTRSASRERSADRLPRGERGAYVVGELDRAGRTGLHGDVRDHRFTRGAVVDRRAVAHFERLGPDARGLGGDADPLVETGGPRPLEHRLHEHHVELVDPVVGTEAPRLDEARARLVEVRHPVRVEHDALPVDLGVADADAVLERRGRHPRSSAPNADLTASMDCCRSSPTSASVSVRSGARNCRAYARLTLPAPSASERNSSKRRTDSSSSPPACSSVRSTAPAGTSSATTNARSMLDAG